MGTDRTRRRGADGPGTRVARDDVPALEGTAVGGSFTLYVDVDDARGLHDRLVDGETPVAQELRETDDGRREFAIEGPNGYVLNFGEKV